MRGVADIPPSFNPEAANPKAQYPNSILPALADVLNPGLNPPLSGVLGVVRCDRPRLRRGSVGTIGKI